MRSTENERSAWAIGPNLRTVATSALVLVLALVLPQEAAAQGKARTIESLFRAVHAREPFNGAVLVRDRGRIVYSKAFGFADFEKRTPLRTSSSFELASVSKPITALAVMMLEERGRLSYDDQLTKYFPELPYPGVTLRHLLTHTSGLPDPEPLFRDGWPAGKVAGNADVVARLALLKPPASFAPGEQWRYNTTSYFLLARIVEKVSGVPFGQFLEANVFRPLGMRDSIAADQLGTRKVSHLARGYMRPSLWSDDYALPETLPRYGYVVPFGATAGSKGVFSSVVDLDRWVTALNRGKLVSKRTLDEAYRPVRLNDGSAPSAGGGAGNDVPSKYGFGWFVENGPDGKTVRHTGDWPGYITCLIHNLDRDQTIVVLSNVGDLSAIGVANAIENILNGRRYRLPRSSIGRAIGKAIVAEGIDAAVGRYHELRKERPDDFTFDSEGDLNTLGYELLRQGKKREAIAVFTLNTEAFPRSWNVFDSLAEAYLANGYKELAVRNYRRSVELNPESRSGIEALKALERE
jgi:CubicO group peptidase (beta-lactamase class C family)